MLNSTNQIKSGIANTSKATPVQPLAKNDKNSILCIKLQWVDGFIKNTSNGQFQIGDFDTKPHPFEEIIATGSSELLCMWVNSMTGQSLTHDYTIDGTPTTLTDRVRIKNQVGAFAFGTLPSVSYQQDSEDEASYNDFKSITINPSFTITFQDKDFENGFNFDLEDLELSLYAFPKETGFKLYFAQVEKMKVIGKGKEGFNTYSYDVSFTHISNKLQKSGMSIEEYIHLSPAGSFFNWPKVNIYANNNKVVKLDEQYQINSGVVYVDEEMYNACIQSSSQFIGWEISDTAEIGKIGQPQLQDDGSYELDIYQPKFLFPTNFTSHSPNILNKATTPISSITHLNKINFEFDRYTDWKTRSTSQITSDYDKKYEGEYTYVDDKDNYDDYEALTTRDDINFYLSNRIANGYFNNTTFGTDSNWTIKTTANWETINMFNSFFNLDILTLPFSFRDNIAHLGKDLPYIGGIWNTMSGGIPTGWSSKIFTEDGNINWNINGLISTHFMNFSAKVIGSPAGFLNDFFADSNKDKLNANNCNFAFTFNLTDTITQPDGLALDTAYLGTGYLPTNGNPLVLTSSDNTKLVAIGNGADEPTYTLSKPNFTDKQINKRYIICSYFNHNFGASGIKLVLKDQNKNPLFQGAYVSRTEYTSNSREWRTNINFNFFQAVNFDTIDNGNIEFPFVPNTNNENGNWIIGNWTNQYSDNVSSVKWDTGATTNSRDHFTKYGWTYDNDAKTKTLAGNIDNYTNTISITNNLWDNDTTIDEMKQDLGLYTIDIKLEENQYNRGQVRSWLIAYGPWKDYFTFTSNNNTISTINGSTETGNISIVLNSDMYSVGGNGFYVNYHKQNITKTYSSDYTITYTKLNNILNITISLPTFNYNFTSDAYYNGNSNEDWTAYGFSDSAGANVKALNRTVSQNITFTLNLPKGGAQ